MTGEFLVNHLWQSSYFVLLPGLLAVVLRKSPPKVRYWVWLSASLKFLVPLTLLMSLGSMVPQSAQRVAWVAAPLPVSRAVLRIAEPFTPASFATIPAHTATHWMPVAIGIVWFLGFLAIASARCRTWFQIRASLRAATPIELPIPIPAVVAPATAEPGIVGFLRPVLVLPLGLVGSLSASQLDAVLAHEMCHVRRRDNFFAAVHMGVEAIFWFHPLVWWIGSRLMEERERACDEAVLQMGCEPADYVEGILRVCRLYRESPLPCVSGVTGADVKKRLRAILSGSIAREWNAGKKVALAAVGLATLATPIVIGVLNAPAIRAQSAAAGTLRFDVASIRPTEFPNDAFAAGYRMAATSSPCTQGQLKVSGTLVSLTKAGICDIIRLAYDLKSYQVLGVPTRLGLSGQDRREASAGGVMQNVQAQIAAVPKEPNPFYDIEARAPGLGTTNDEQVREMLRALLTERFHLTAHREDRELSFLALVQAKGGAKLKPASESCKPHGGLSLMAPCGQTMEQVARYLNLYADHQVIDMTGLAGKYDYEVPIDREDANFGAAVTAAIQDRLGLRLEVRKGPIDVLVVDRVEAPSEN